VLAKHSKSFSLIDCVSVGVDRMQRNFEPILLRTEIRGIPVTHDLESFECVYVGI